MVGILEAEYIWDVIDSSAFNVLLQSEFVCFFFVFPIVGWMGAAWCRRKNFQLQKVIALAELKDTVCPAI